MHQLIIKLIILFFFCQFITYGKGQGIIPLEKCFDLMEEGNNLEAIESLLFYLEEEEIREGWDENRFATIYTLISNYYYSIGDLGGLSKLNSKAMGIFNEKSPIPNTEFSRYLHRMYGAIYMELKDYSAAISCLETAQWFYEDESEYDRGYFSILTLLGGAYLQSGDIINAKLYLEEAENIHLKYIGPILNSDYIDSYQLLNYRGLLEQNFGNVEKAENYFNSIIENAPRSIWFEEIRKIASINLGILYTLIGEYIKAEKIYNSIEFTLPQHNYNKYESIAFHNLLNNDYDKAFNNLALSNVYGMDYLQSVIFSFSEIERQEMWAKNLDQMVKDNNFFAMWINRENEVQNGFEFNCFAKEFKYNFSKIIKSNYNKESDIYKNKKWSQYQELVGQLSYGYSSKELRDSLIYETILIEKEILSECAIDLKYLYKENYNFKKIKSNLNKDEMIIDMIHMSIQKGLTKEDGFEPGYFAYCVTSNSEYPQLIPLCKQQDIIDIIYDLNPDELFINEIYTKKKDLLFDKILKPLERLIQNKRKLYIRTIGYLSTINFDAITLPNGKRFGEEFDVHLFSTLESLSRTEEQYSWSDMALFGNPDFKSSNIKKTQLIPYELNREFKEITRGIRGNWEDLGGTQLEVEKIGELANTIGINTTIFTQNKATETSLKELTGLSPKILHLATHGYFISSSEEAKTNNFFQNSNGYGWGNHLMLYSGLLLSGANKVWNGEILPNPYDDGVLTADEISRLDLSNTELVVLSACDTGRGHLNGTDGIMGLQSAFRSAGVKTMILSLWKTNDDATYKLMVNFYKYLFSGENVRNSLRLSQQDLRDMGYQDPYYWAPFVVLD